jgi:hypothetical protein
VPNPHIQMINGRQIRIQVNNKVEKGQCCSLHVMFAGCACGPPFRAGENEEVRGQAEPSHMRGARTLGQYDKGFVAFDVAKKKHDVRSRKAAGPGKSISRRCRKQSASDRADDQEIGGPVHQYDRLHVCFEAGPTGRALPPD